MGTMAGRASNVDLALEQLTSRRVPGISAAVVGPDGLEQISSAGKADLASGRPGTPETIYLWFSMTKILTATATMQLAEDGVLSLEDPVDSFLSEFPKPRSADAANHAEPTGPQPRIACAPGPHRAPP
jgi:CubicO group peptidase (beta-lactamase class C family)